MVKGVAAKFKSYEETISKILDIVQFNDELKKHEKIVLKPNLIEGKVESSTPAQFLEQVLKYCMANKSPGAQVFIAEGCDGKDTMDVFDEFGYTHLSEKYGIGIIDLNNTETEELTSDQFLEFESIKFPQILRGAFVISLPRLGTNENTHITASLDNMLGAYPAKHYKGLFSKTKNKLEKHPVEYQIHDILKCKTPNFTIIDASDKGLLLIGQPFEMDKQASKLLGLNWMEIPHLSLLHNPPKVPKIEKEINELINTK
jgi:uncharacterized protein (DUF362 family)